MKGCLSWLKLFLKNSVAGVIAVARKSEAPLTQIAKDFGISPSCLHSWLKKADVETDRPGDIEGSNLPRCEN
jgi:hypothetical protein